MKPDEKPRNGLAGLKHWRYDLLAGMQVALVSLPLSLGIAIASGAPPVTGLVSAIIAGLIFPFLGGAYVTISGPAAGLAPALLAGMLVLGGGDLSEGYPLILVAIFLTGVIMIILAQLKAGKLVAMFLPVTVVEAMLAAIGLMIIIKQVPSLVGDLSSTAKPMLESILTLPESFLRIDPLVMLIGAVCLFLMFYLNRTRHEWMRKIPAPLTVCAIGIGFGYLFSLDAAYLISMPENLLEEGITLPAFNEVFSRSELWAAVIIIVITLTLIDSIESLATVSAVDKIDPYRRKSEPNTTLRAMGVSNVLSSMAGGLTIIPGGIKSRANIDAGGRTLWANFANAIFLLLFLFFAAKLIGRIPLAAIGAVIVYVGWRLCEPKVFIKTKSIGRDHIIVFVSTIIAILATDLLVGIIIGIVIQLMLNSYLLAPSLRMVITGRISPKECITAVLSVVAVMFRSPVIQMRENGDDNGQHLSQLSLKSLTGFNLLMVDRAINRIPEDSGIRLVLSESGRMIDRTTMEYLHELQEDCLQGNRLFEIVGLERFHPFTDHPFSTRVQDKSFVRERAERDSREHDMKELSGKLGFRFTPETVATLDRHDFVYLRRGANRQERNTMTGDHEGYRVRVFDYSHTSAPEYYVEHRHTLVVLQPDPTLAGKLPDLAFTPGHYLERYLIAQYSELDLSEIDQPFTQKYRVFAKDQAAVSSLLNTELTGLMVAHAGSYVEIRRGALLVFRPGNDLEQTDAVVDLMDFASRLLTTITARLPRT